MFACFLKFEVVGDDLGVIEDDRGWEVIEVEVLCDFGVIVATGSTVGGGGEYGGHRMLARIAVGIGVDVKEGLKPDVESGFFFGFADGSMFDGFAFVDEAAGQSPAQGGIASFDENDLMVFNDEGIDSGGGISVFHGEFLGGLRYVVCRRDVSYPTCK